MAFLRFPRGRVLAGLITAATMGACGREQSRPVDGPEGHLPGRTEPVCTVSELGRRYLPDELGLHLYVEPQAFGSYDGGLLVAGAPTYATRITSGDRASLSSSNDFFGALVVGDTVQRIPIPPGVRAVGWVRGSPLAEDRWGFVFDEVEEPTFPDEVLLRILYGEYGPRGWGPLEELPLPPDASVEVAMGSSLVELETGPAWAALAFDERGRPGTLLFIRGPRGWTRNLVLEDGADALDLAVGSDGAFVLAVAGLDPEYGSRLSSVRIYPSPGGDSLPIRIARGAPGGGRHRAPLLVDAGTEIQAAWLSSADPPSGGAWTATVSLDDTMAIDPPEPLDGRAMLLRLAGVRDGAVFWTTLAVDPVTGTRRIRLFRSAGGDVRRIADVESPYLGPFAASLSPRGELVLVGPEAHMDSPTPFVRSLLLRFDLSCTPVTAADHLPGR